MKVFLCFLTILFWAGTTRAADGPFSLASEGEPARSLRDFDIDEVVEAVTAGMTEASRNYYLPDKPENAKAISRYRKDARFLMKHNSAFRLALGDICVALARVGVEAVNHDYPRLPGKPLSLSPKQRYEPYDEGVSSITITEGDMTVIFTNTMPCINAAGGALFDGVRDQYMPKIREGSPEQEHYKREASSIMSSNQLYNHVLAEVCEELVQVAKRHAEGKDLRR